MGDTKERLTLSDAQGWGEFGVGDLFDITRGKRITKAFAEEHSGNIPVIAGGESNNGILCYLSEDCKNIRVWKNECITVASYGTAGCVHYQGQTSFIDDKALALELKNHRKNMYIYLFMSAILEGLRGKYNYGYGVTPDRYEAEKILLPTTPDGKPDYDFMENYIKQLYDDFADRVCVYQEPVSSDADISLSDREWKEFKVGDLFSIEKCKCGSASKLSDGTIPYVGATNRNNGVLRYVDAENKMITKGNCIAFICDGQGSVGHSIYKKESFVGSTTVKVGRNEKLNQYNGQFIVTVLETNADIYNYGYKRNDERLRNEIIYLPVTADDQPDYDFMEQYIKSLPFSKAMEL